MSFSNQNPTARTSCITSENAKQHEIGLQALDQIKEFGYTYLKKDDVRSQKLKSIQNVYSFFNLNRSTLYKHQEKNKPKYFKKANWALVQQLYLSRSSLTTSPGWMTEDSSPNSKLHKHHSQHMQVFFQFVKNHSQHMQVFFQVLKNRSQYIQVFFRS